MLKFSACSCLTSDNINEFDVGSVVAKRLQSTLYYPSSHEAIRLMSNVDTATCKLCEREPKLTHFMISDECLGIYVKDTLKQTCLSPGGGASCFRNSNDSRPAIRIAYRTLLRSSSI